MERDNTAEARPDPRGPWRAGKEFGCYLKGIKCLAISLS